MWARVISGIIGVFMLLQAFLWLIDPLSAAQSLSMSLLEGEGGNTQIGDFTSFFFTAGLMATIGAYRSEHLWLYTTISLLGSAAIFRISAGLFHGTDFLTSAIAFEIIASILLLISANKIKSEA
ncbi:MAG: hypothetical protein CMD61_03975 [Gammaproteobacteria bacterium]|jgi:hypothetical protein|nr:hypothetical protein [Gammaproteobacteria bacterium]|tara:strand:+ start:720 stop:1091 length:372 start_codon:yes stop_codon:yes gene_type:complete